MAISFASRVIVQVDRIVDYIPILSIVNNSAIIIAKIALALFSHYFPSMYERIQGNLLIDHVMNQKSVFQCIGVAIPFLNIFVALCRDFSQPMLAALETLDRMSAPPEDPAVAVMMRDLPEQFNRQTEELNRQVAEINARTEQRNAERRAERKRNLDAHFAKCDEGIARCPDTEEGRQMRDSLLQSKELAQQMFAHQDQISSFEF